jgi:hypothetical protein
VAISAGVRREPFWRRTRLIQTRNDGPQPEHAMSRRLGLSLIVVAILGAAAMVPSPAAAIMTSTTSNPQIHLHVHNEMLHKTPRIDDKLRLKIICYYHRERTEPFGTYVTVKTCGPG